MTPLAEAVLIELKTARRGFKAHALAKTISEKCGRMIAPNSIYRALGRLEKDGYIRKIASANAFFALDNISRKAFCLLACRVCGEIDAIPCQETGTQLQELAKACDFKPETLVIEMIGNCATCELSSIRH